MTPALQYSDTDLAHVAKGGAGNKKQDISQQTKLEAEADTRPFVAKMLKLCGRKLMEVFNAARDAMVAVVATTPGEEKDGVAEDMRRSGFPHYRADHTTGKLQSQNNKSGEGI